MTKLILFDIDGTLADRDSQILLPSVRDWFDQEASKYQIALCTNQGGTGLRFWMERQGFGDPSKFPTEKQAVDHILRIMDQLTPQGRHDPNLSYYVCFAYQSKTSGQWGPTPPGRAHEWQWQKTYRKPFPGLFLLAMKDAGVDPSETLAVGDGEEDMQAAARAYCTFQWANIFFGRS